jgi:hypothetical protein
MLVAQELGEPAVVVVAVGQHERPDMLDAPTHRREFGGQGRVVRRDARIDDGDLAGFLDEVAADDLLAEPVQ